MLGSVLRFFDTPIGGQIFQMRGIVSEYCLPVVDEESAGLVNFTATYYKEVLKQPPPDLEFSSDNRVQRSLAAEEQIRNIMANPVAKHMCIRTNWKVNPNECIYIPPKFAQILRMGDYVEVDVLVGEDVHEVIQKVEGTLLATYDEHVIGQVSNIITLNFKPFTKHTVRPKTWVRQLRESVAVTGPTLLTGFHLMLSLIEACFGRGDRVCLMAEAKGGKTTLMQQWMSAFKRSVSQTVEHEDGTIEEVNVPVFQVFIGIERREEEADYRKLQESTRNTRTIFVMSNESDSGLRKYCTTVLGLNLAAALAAEGYHVVLMMDSMTRGITGAMNRMKRPDGEGIGSGATNPWAAVFLTLFFALGGNTPNAGSLTPIGVILVRRAPGKTDIDTASGIEIQTAIETVITQMKLTHYISDRGVYPAFCFGGPEGFTSNNRRIDDWINDVFEVPEHMRRWFASSRKQLIEYLTYERCLSDLQATNPNITRQPPAALMLQVYELQSQRLKTFYDLCRFTNPKGQHLHPVEIFRQFSIGLPLADPQAVSTNGTSQGSIPSGIDMPRLKSVVTPAVLPPPTVTLYINSGYTGRSSQQMDKVFAYLKSEGFTLKYAVTEDGLPRVDEGNRQNQTHLVVLVSEEERIRKILEDSSGYNLPVRGGSQSIQRSKQAVS